MKRKGRNGGDKARPSEQTLDAALRVAKTPWYMTLHIARHQHLVIRL